MNRVILSGYLLHKVNHIKNDAGSIAMFTISNVKNVGGKKHTTLVKAIAWGKIADRIAEQCRAGMRIVCVGELENYKRKKDGEEPQYHLLRLRVSEFGCGDLENYYSYTNEETPE